MDELKKLAYDFSQWVDFGDLDLKGARDFEHRIRLLRIAALPQTGVVPEGSAMRSKWWLIEYKPSERETDQSPRWWNGTAWNAYSDVGWSRDANNAIKFTDYGSSMAVTMNLHRARKDLPPRMGYKVTEVKHGDYCPTEHEFIDVAAAPPPPKVEQGQWRPISEAPRDGTVIHVARHMGTFGWILGTSHWESIRGIEGWISRGLGVFGELGLAEPTHWMPLPPPPTTGEKP